MSTGMLQLAGTTYDVIPRVDPAPAVGGVPAGVRSVLIGARAFPVDAVDPTALSNPLGASYAGYRGPGQIIVYTKGAATVTNFWGVELAVSPSGLIVAVNDRIASRSATGTPIPTDGCVISGHVPVAAALKAAAALVPSAPVVWSTDPVPATQPAPAPATADGFVLAEYLLDGQGGIPALSQTCTQCRVAFIRLSGGKLVAVEWGGETPAQTQSGLATWVQGPPAGRRVLLSFGGQDGGTTFGDVAAFARGYVDLAAKYKATGLDVDLEGGALDIASCVAVCRACAALQPGFLASFVPPGGPPVTRYLEAARQVQAAGTPVQFGQQLYDAVVTKTQAIEQTRLAVGVLGQESVLVGVMIGNDAKHWTPAQADDIVGAVLEEFPRLGGVYFWEASRAGTDEASALVAARAARVRAAAAA